MRLARPSLRQFAEQERQDSCYHHVSGKMCKTEDAQIQDLSENQSWGLQNTTQIHQGVLLQLKCTRVQDWYHPIIVTNPTADLPLQSRGENLVEKRCRESITPGSNLPRDQELGACAQTLEEQIQIYRKPYPEQVLREKKGGKKALF